MQLQTGCAQLLGHGLCDLSHNVSGFKLSGPTFSVGAQQRVGVHQTVLQLTKPSVDEWTMRNAKKPARCSYTVVDLPCT